jgi:hypothetical protein
MHDPQNGEEFSMSVRPLSVCLNCGRTMNIAFSVPAKHELELRIFQCEHCNFEDIILRQHVSLPAPKQLTYLRTHGDDRSQVSS